MKRKYVCFIASAAWVGSNAGAMAADVAAGATVFNQKCKVCHQIGESAKNSVGPELNGLIGRKTGSIADYNYSDANKDSGITWDEATLNAYLANPKAKIPGTKMIFAGLPKDTDRDNLVAYLAQFGSDGKKSSFIVLSQVWPANVAGNPRPSVRIREDELAAIEKQAKELGTAILTAVPPKK